MNTDFHGCNSGILPEGEQAGTPVLRNSVRDRLDGQAIYIRKDARTGQWKAFITEYAEHHDHFGFVPMIEFSATAEDPVAAIVRLARDLQKMPGSSTPATALPAPHIALSTRPNELAASCFLTSDL
jgi:hypothetical protein